MADKKVDITVQRIGDKVSFQLDPEALAKSGSCCNCNSQAFSLEALARASESK